MLRPRSESAPGTLKRFDSSEPRFEVAAPPSTNSTIHVSSTIRRWRTTNSVDPLIGRRSYDELFFWVGNSGGGFGRGQVGQSSRRILARARAQRQSTRDRNRVQPPPGPQAATHCAPARV